jgi:hypothetical protein
MRKFMSVASDEQRSIGVNRKFTLVTGISAVRHAAAPFSFDLSPAG